MSSPELAALADIVSRRSHVGDAPVLELRNVSVRFGGVAAVDDISFDVGRHDIVAIVGANGAGKTTTLNAISRLVRSSGDIMFEGQPIQRVDARRLGALGIGRSFQDPHLIDRYSVVENVLCGAHARLRYGATAQVFRRRTVRRAEHQLTQQALGLLDLVGLKSHADTEAASLPYGARKLTDIVRAMIMGPSLLLLDEPSSGLDQDERDGLQATLLSLRAETGMAILAVEHHMDLVRSVATKVTALHAGEVLMSGSPTEVLDSEIVRNAFVGAEPGPDGEPAGSGQSLAGSRRHEDS